MTKGTQKLTYEPGSTKYYSNCRGFNYVPIAYSEWEKSGFAPRVSIQYFSGLTPGNLFLLLSQENNFYHPSATFKNNSKTAQWWYYNHNDNDRCLGLLRSVGVNAIRVWTNIYVWEKKQQQHINDLKDFMSLCDKYKMRVQWVLFDGVYAPAGVAAEFEPGSTNVTSTASLSANIAFTDHVYFALMQDWTRSPYGYHVSSEAATINFFQNSATPYINQICQNLSSFQSLWCFDLGNETDPGGDQNITQGIERFKLYASSSYLLSSNLSSIGIGITFGNGDNFRPWDQPLAGGINNGQTYPYYNTPLDEYSGIYNFATIHPYRTNNKFSANRDIRDAVSGSLKVGKPVMANEINYVNGMFISDMLQFYNKNNQFGTLVWDAFEDLAVSREVFGGIGGVFHWDGEVRRSEDTDAFIDLAVYHGWLKRSQLKKAKQKNNSSRLGQGDDTGQDGGFTSATVAFHKEYIPELHVSCVTKSRYDFAIAMVYPQISNPIAGIIAGLLGYGSSDPKNYRPWFDQQPFSNLITDIHSSKISFKEMLYSCRNYKTEFKSFSSILLENGINPSNPTPASATSAGPIYKLLNAEAMKKDYYLQLVSENTATVYQAFPDSFLVGSQYDEYPSSSLRLHFSSQYFPILRARTSEVGPFPGYDGSTVICWANNKNLDNTSSTPHYSSGTGYYLTPSNKNSGLDWLKYDELFNNCFSSLNIYLDEFYKLAETDDKFELD